MKEFSIYHIFQVFIKNIFIILLSAVIFGVATFCYCEFHLQERYASTGSIVVTNGGVVASNTQNNQITDSNKVANSDISASINLLSTITDILKTNDIYKELATNLGNKYTYRQLKACATVIKHGDYSLFIDIRFEMHNKDEVSRITDMFLELVPDYVNKFIPDSLVTVVPSSGAVVKTYPRTFAYTALATIIGAFLAFAIFYIISLFDTTIASEEAFKERYEIPVLGDIPDFVAAKTGKYGKSYYKGGKYYGSKRYYGK